MRAWPAESPLHGVGSDYEQRCERRLWHTGSRDTFLRENPNDIESADQVLATFDSVDKPVLRYRLRLRQGHLQGRLRDGRSERVEQDGLLRAKGDTEKRAGGHRY